MLDRAGLAGDGRPILLPVRHGRVAVMRSRDWAYPTGPRPAGPLRSTSRAALAEALLGLDDDPVRLRAVHGLLGTTEAAGDAAELARLTLAEFDRRRVTAVWMPPASAVLTPSGTGPDVLLRLAAGQRVAAVAAPAPPAPSGVGGMGLEDRLGAVLFKVPDHLPGSMVEEFRALLSPLAIGVTIGVLAAWAASHAFGVGFVVDIVLAVVGIATLGFAVFDAAAHLWRALELTRTATTHAQIDEAAKELAAFIAMVGVGAFAALVARGAGRVGRRQAPRERPPGGGPSPSPPPPPPRSPREPRLPQGVSNDQFRDASQAIRRHTGEMGDDVVVQGSRAAGTARPDSDIDIGVRVPSDRFDRIVRERFGNPNPGSAKEATMRAAMERGRIHGGEAGLRPLRRELEGIFGRDVDVSIIRRGGPFDSEPNIPIR